jgi:predicted acyltransferase (DUF342 family)
VPSFRSDPLEELVIPDGTHVEEHDLVASGDVIVGGQTTVEFGVRGRNVIAGERVAFGGHIEAEGDCRLDMWCGVADNVLVGEDAYLGERVEIDGELKVAGDLDIGDDVDIEDGFEANGWIVIRNPMPTIVFLFVYLSQLLRIGEEEAAEEMLTALVDDEDRENQPVVIPRGSTVGDDAWRVSTPARIGDGCRLHGNIRAASLVVGHDNEIFGALRAKEDLTVGGGTEVTGNVTTRNGDAAVGPGATIRGDVAAEHVEVHSDATVEGEIRARSGMTMVDEPVIDAPVIGEIAAQDAAEKSEADADTEADPETPVNAEAPEAEVSTGGDSDGKDPDADAEPQTGPDDDGETEARDEETDVTRAGNDVEDETGGVESPDSSARNDDGGTGHVENGHQENGHDDAAEIVTPD